MNDALRVGKKAFTLVVAFATIFSMVGLSAFVAPLTASAATDFEAGDLIMGETLSTVYYYGTDGQRYAFPNEKTFFSWYDDFSGVVSITDDELADITLAGNVVYRPGTNWIKIESDATTYIVSTDGSIHPILDEATAVALGGDSWATLIHDVPDVFFVDYTVGTEIASDSDVVDGMLVADGGDYYLVWDGEARLITDGLTANGLDSAFALAADVSALDMGDEVTSALSNVTDTAQLIEEETVTEMTEVTVSLGDNSPSALTVATGESSSDEQGMAHVASFTFDNPTSDELAVTNLAVTRGGVSSDSSVANIYLFDGYERLTDSVTLTSGMATWNDASGLFTVPANSSATVDVWAEIEDGVSGQTFNLGIASADDIVFDGDYEATGSFPLTGATHSIATVSSLGYLDFNTTTTPGTTTMDPQDDYRVWQNTVNVSGNEVDLYSLRFRNIGSIDMEDIGNYRLYIDGVQYGDAIEMQDANGYFTFDLSDEPVNLNTGNRVFKVLADVTGGSTRTVSISLRSAADVLSMDEDYDQAVTALANSATFSARTSGAITINSGYLTIAKADESPSGNVTLNAAGSELGVWDVKAYGEDMKVEGFNFYVDYTDNHGGGGADADVTLRNGSVYADGVQIGNTTGLIGSTTTGTDYNFGSSLIIEAGETVQVSVNADIYDNESANNLADTDTLKVYMDADTDNVLAMTSVAYGDYPASEVAANELTVSDGAVTVSEYSAFADPDITADKSAEQIGSYIVSASTTEDVNLNTLEIDFTLGTAVITEVTNVYLMYGDDADNLTQSAIKGTVSALDNEWSIDYTLPASEDMYVEVYADLASSMSSSDTVTTNLEATGTGAGSSEAITDNTGGQTVTIQTSAFTTAVDGATPSAALVAGGQTLELAKYELSAQYDDYYIQEIRVDIATAASASNGYLFIDGEEVSNAVFSGLTATFYLDDYHIPAGEEVVVSAKVDLNEVTSAATFRKDAALTMDYVKYYDSTGLVAENTDSRPANQMIVYAGVPTLTHVDLTNATLVNGTPTEVYKYTVSATGADIAIKQFTFAASLVDTGTAGDTLDMESWKLYKDGTNITDDVNILDAAGANIKDATGFGETGSGSVIVSWDTEVVIEAGDSVTFSLKATPQGFNVTDADSNPTDYFSMYLGLNATNEIAVSALPYVDDEDADDIWGLSDDVGDLGTETEGFGLIWSDKSATGHDATHAASTADWTSGYNVLNLDLDGETWED